MLHSIKFHNWVYIILVLCIISCQKDDRDNNIDHLLRNLGNENQEVHEDSINKISNLGDEALPYLSKILQTSDNKVLKYKAAYSLALIGKKSVPSLIDALRNGDLKTKESACFGIGQIGQRLQMPYRISLKHLKMMKLVLRHYVPWGK